MLKSFEYIKEMEVILSKLKESKRLLRFHIKLSVNQQLDVFISSDSILNINDLADAIDNLNSEHKKIDLLLNSVMFEFLTSEEAEEKSYYFKEENVDLGLRRSLDNLIDGSVKEIQKKANIITFYSHKGGVGRTTSLALLARYYSEQGRKVFTIDCDFEAPGLLNFFSISQFNTPKNGVIEYLNDKKFDEKTSINEDYVYQISKRYSGEGIIHMMPAGNVFSLSKKQYLEGLSRLDIFGPSVFLKDMNSLIDDIQSVYEPDVILIDSRTGFNNVFGCLSKISDHVVALFGDDIQNKPGMEFILDKYSDSKLHSKLTFVLSIISANFRKRLASRTTEISNYMSEYDYETVIPSFVFPRESALEMIGTPEESEEDFKYFSSKGSPTSYTPFFSHMENILNGLIGINSENTKKDNDKANNENSSEKQIIYSEIEKPLSQSLDISIKDENGMDSYSNKIVRELLQDFPELYAENVTFDDEYLKNIFYIRKCMQDIFLPEYKLLIGGKGTGKTYFYKALRNNTFVDALLSRAEKKPRDYIISNIISDNSSNTGFIELTSQLLDNIDNEVFVRKFWVIYIWAELSSQSIVDIETSCDFVIQDDAITAKKIKDIIYDEDYYLTVELELSNIDKYLKKMDQRLIAIFDRLDNVVKPMHWDKAISPLIRICQSNSWDRIQPKLFLRRDLFEKLGNITNKQSLASQTIDLEWSSDEMYAFFFKIIYSNSEKSFYEFLNNNFTEIFVKDSVIKKLNKKNSFNQLPDDIHILKPLVNAFFGEPKMDYVDAYEALYRNIRNANQTISLRPFLDMIRFAIEEQLKDSANKRRNAVLGIDYCFLRSVRAKAVERYFKDMAQEEGNDIIKYFIEDIQNNKVPPQLKCSSLLQRDFEKLVEAVRGNHSEIKNIPTTTFEEMLVLNGIIFVTIIPGGIKKFSFAYLYKFYLNLNSPNQKKKWDR